MKFEGFQVTNFRNVIDSGWINANQITAFVGQNEAGKSNLFEALYCVNPIIEEADYNLNEDWPVDNGRAGRTLKANSFVTPASGSRRTRRLRLPLPLLTSPRLRPRAKSLLPPLRLTCPPWPSSTFTNIMATRPTLMWRASPQECSISRERPHGPRPMYPSSCTFTTTICLVLKLS